MDIRIVKCKSLLVRSKLPESSYSINPYIGCSYGCIYCYARFMKRFVDNDRKWGDFVWVKINAAEVLKKELLKRPKKGLVVISSVTDPYQPIEKRYMMTRSILKLLLKYDFPISILTKSDLVIRDIDLLRRFSRCKVGLTITTIDEKISKDFEPRAPSPMQRIKALEKIHQYGIKTYAFIGPILPGLTNLNEYI